MRNLVIVFISFLLLFSCDTNSKKKAENLKNGLTSEFKTVKFESSFLEKTNFLNGDAIQQAQSASEWKLLCEAKTPAWCYADEKNKTGILYNFYVLLDKRGILSESQQLTEALAEKLNNELLKTEDLKLKLGEKSTIQRTFYGSNCDLKFFQTWIFRFDNTDGNKVLTMVWDLPNKKFRIDSVSMNNGFRIWALKK